MEVDKKFHGKTMRTEEGQYPVWMNQRAIRKQKGHKNKKVVKKGKQKKGKLKF